jgi:hypothetical protein
VAVVGGYHDGLPVAMHQQVEPATQRDARPLVRPEHAHLEHAVGTRADAVVLRLAAVAVDHRHLSRARGLAQRGISTPGFAMSVLLAVVDRPSVDDLSTIGQ